MDFDDSPQEAAFRAEVRSWLDAHAEPKADARERISVMEGFSDDPDDIEVARHWQRQLFEGGLAAVTWPAEHGGRALGVVEAMVLSEEQARYDVPQSVFSIGIGMIGPTIIAHGTPEQQQRYLPPMLRGDEIWCQLWSEPDAGSDLAGLTTRAVLDGDEFVLDGQKVWTSGAHYSQFGLGVFRTNPEVPKHKGISVLIVPLETPGIEVSPLRQITGESHFNEVFFDGARVPASNLVGDLDDGWRVARTTMMNERLSAGAMASATDAVSALVKIVRSTPYNGGTLAGDPVVRQRLARTYTLSRLFDLTSARVRSALSRQSIPGPEVSILKLFAAQLWTVLAETGSDILGSAGTLVGEDAPEGGRWPAALLSSFAMHIGGGTDQIQRNIIGETVLGLPREPSTDKDVPFRDLRVGTQRAQ